MSQLVVDTDILIDVMRNVEIARHRLKQEETHLRLVISSITKKELLQGCANKREWNVVTKFIDSFPIIYLTEDIDNIADNLLERYCLSHGLQIGDALIAATGIYLNIPLLSKNQRDFRFIEELELLPYP